jgi:hypothetical protein
LSALERTFIKKVLTYMGNAGEGKDSQDRVISGSHLRIPFSHVSANDFKLDDYRIQNTEHRIQNTEYRIQNTEYRIQNKVYRIQKLMYIKLPKDL